MDKKSPGQSNKTPTPLSPPKQSAAIVAPGIIDDGFALEAGAYLRGLFQEFEQQKRRYSALTAELLSLEAKIELAERTLCLVRDHFAMAIQKTDSDVPIDWTSVLHRVRFVGMRLADACAVLLQEHKKMTPKEILVGLNSGMFRFRTNSPLREINAALLRQNSVERVDDAWVWTGVADQKRMRFRVLDAKTARSSDTTTNVNEKMIDQSKH